MNSIEKALSVLYRGTQQVTPHEDLLAKLKSGRKLIIKLGMDPTAPDLHLGHAVVLTKLKELQELGHTIILIIGDFTAGIGDPTGRSKTRPPLTQEAIERNTQTYFKQVSTIIDPSKVTIRYNSEWLNKLTPQEWVTLCASTTLARLIEREDFAIRMANHLPIGFHELLYPLMQGYDSVELKADIELGGTDQTFNLFMGRFLQEHFKLESQVIMTMPLLEGLDGSLKMSKSLGNAIGLTEKPEQAFGKLMSISDTLMWHYAALLGHKTASTIAQLQEEVSSGKLHAMRCKKMIAHEIVSRFWSPAGADAGQARFESLIQNKDYDHATIVHLPNTFAKKIWIVDFLKQLHAITSSSEGRRLIEANAIEIDGIVIRDFKELISWQPGTTVKVGKHRFYKIG